LSASGPGWLRFNLKTIGRSVDCTREEIFASAQWHGRQLPAFRPLPRNLKAMGEITLAAYWQLWKPMFKEVTKKACHEGTHGFYWKPNFENVTDYRSNEDGGPIKPTEATGCVNEVVNLPV
jgi:hypothetical protein